jgi:hypothetical protein
LLGFAVLLGFAAFVGDAVPGRWGRLVLALTSSGLAWGLAALLAASTRRSSRSAMLASTSLLVIATMTYYVLILFVSRRWQPTGAAGLSSVARAAAFWTLGSLCAGPLLGLLAWRLRSGGPRENAVLSGVVFGLFSAQGFHTLFFQTGWMSLDDFGRGLLQPAMVTIALSAVTTAYLAAGRQARGLLLLSATVSAVMGTAMWWSVESARVLVSI